MIFKVKFYCLSGGCFGKTKSEHFPSNKLTSAMFRGDRFGSIIVLSVVEFYWFRVWESSILHSKQFE